MFFTPNSSRPNANSSRRSRNRIAKLMKLEERLAMAAAIHLDASEVASIQTDADSNVTAWLDQSAHGNNASADLGNVVYTGNERFDGGFAGLDFGSSRSTLELATGSESDSWLDQSEGDGGFTIAMTLERRGTVSTWNDVLGNTTSVGSGGFGIRLSSGGQLRAYLGGTNVSKSDAYAAIDETIALTFRYDATTDTYSYWDSATGLTQTGTIQNGDFSLESPVRVGGMGGKNRHFDGLIGEIQIHEVALADEELESLQSGLVSKWIDPSLIRWTDYVMPDGSVPTSNDVIVVESGTTLLVDGPMEVEGLIVVGDLVVEDGATPIEITSDWILVTGGGRFLIGSPQNPYQNDFTLNLVGEDLSFDLNVGDYLPGNEMVISNNNAYLMAMGAETEISIHAADASKTTWSQLAATAEAGSNAITVADPTGWEVGDEIAIASTDFDLNQAEQFQIAAIDGNTITLDNDLAYMHYGEIETYGNADRTWELDMRAEVSLLNRNVTIQGRSDAGTDLIRYDGEDRRVGGHTMVMRGAEMYLSGVAFHRMGQEGIVGRYPTHWHLSGDVSADTNSQDSSVVGQYIKNSSFVDTYNKGVTIHGAQFALVENNLIYEHIGHGVYGEDGAEWGNQVLGNLSINARKSLSRDLAAVSSDFSSVANFWFKHYDNTLEGNHAAGSEGHGYYYDLDRIRNASHHTGLYDDVDPAISGPVGFSGNTAHSFTSMGVYVNQILTNRIGDVDFDAKTPQLGNEDWAISGSTIYKGGTGLYARGIGGDFVDSVVAEVGRGTTRLRLNQTVYDSAFIGRSGNLGTPDTDAEIAEGRSMFENDSRFAGHQFYDGPGGLVNVHFDGFDTGDDAAIVQSNAVHKSTSWFVTGLTWGPNTEWEHRVDFSSNRDWNEGWAHAMVDLDGSLSGVEGATIIPRINGGSEFNASRNAKTELSWGTGARINEASSYAATLSFNGPSPVSETGLLTFDLTREDIGGGAPIHIEDYRGNSSYSQFAFVINDGFEYTVDFDTSDNDFSDELNLYLRDVLEGDSQVFRLESINVNANVEIYDPYLKTSKPAAEVSSLDTLRETTTTSFFRTADALYVNLVSEDAYGWLWPQPDRTIGDRVIGGVYVRITDALPVVTTYSATEIVSAVVPAISKPALPTSAESALHDKPLVESDVFNAEFPDQEIAFSRPMVENEEVNNSSDRALLELQRESNTELEETLALFASLLDAA